MNILDILISNANRLKNHYWPLIKSRQTFLLTLTGVAGYLYKPPLPIDWSRFLSLVGSLSVTISGCTIVNMVLDRDIDSKMVRTKDRPLAAKQVNPQAAAILGWALTALGLLWALKLSLSYFFLGLLGAGLDVLIYTLWLKRRSVWSIFWGGISGGIPILAGRSLVIGKVDSAGLLLAISIVCWIPSHNLTLSMLYSSDYLYAGIPSFLNTFGLAATRATLALSSLITIILMEAAFILLNYPLLAIAIISTIGFGQMGLAFYSWARYSRKIISALYKYSSLYMLISMLLLAFASLK